ncbi:MAG TPA: amylo-alpha-1,6-glucosidase [Polyangia bacterium]|jgi:glycogen debranching enzyme|nr:amylo-alpha-1,6-glucosidase [Polyangia bacterium]
MDEDVIEIAGQFYIRATSGRSDERTRVLKHDDTFGVFDRFGDVRPIASSEQGLFHRGTRHLSRLELRLGRDRSRALLLSSTVSDANEALTADLTNPDITGPDQQILLRRGILHILRMRFLWKGVCYERLRVANHGLSGVPVSLELLFDADFVDIFEVRGQARPRRGQMLPPAVDGDRCVLAYEGLDHVVRRTALRFSPLPDRLEPGRAQFDLTVEPQRAATIEMVIGCEEEGGPRFALFPPDDALAQSTQALRAQRGHQVQVEGRNEQLASWIRRSVADLHMMTSTTPHGPYPYAGVPWFSTAFGRDGIITAFQTLWWDASLARGVLAFLAANQAKDDNPQQEAEPGKILHETRTGEMAALGEVPFGCYYGSVDSTPLFVMLAGAYLERTGDVAFARTLWPHVERALGWMDRYGDRDGDGFIEYAQRGEKGLVQQGWKDSHDSVFHADGTLAEPPIALCEVQGYAYGARLAAAELAAALGKHAEADKLRARAARLRDAFAAAFWCDDLQTFALALDGHKRPCRVRSSNAGQCLWSGIATDEHARAVAATLLHPSGSSGWGIRTLAATEARYNPISYHNGSIWPHDNALIAAGFSRYGLMAEALHPFSALLAASAFLDLQRLPELYCGFERRAGEGPTLYPVACLPQAWAAGSLFMFLQALLGMRVRAAAREVRFENPVLPEGIDELRLRNLMVGDGSIDLLLERHPHDVGLTVLQRQGKVSAVVAL